MKGIVVPERTEDFTADQVELFFDLAFVFAFSQLVSHLVHHPTWTGFGEAALIFTLLWLGWSQFTWAANAVSGNSRVARVVFLAGTAISLPMAASVTTAFGGGGPVFSICLGLIFFLSMRMMFTAYPPGSDERKTAIGYAIPVAGFVAVLVAGAFFEGQARVIVWLCAMMLFFYSTFRAGEGKWIIRAGHMAERHGLITIIALGEVIVAIGIGVVAALEVNEAGETSGLGTTTLIALLASAVFATVLWWSYFDRAQPAFEHHAEGLPETERGRFARDAYTYAHLPVVGGVVVAAAALEEITLHPDDVVHSEFLVMLLGGMALYFGGIAFAVRRAFSVIARERLVGTVILGLVLLAMSNQPGWQLIVAVDLVLVVVIGAEHIRVERVRHEAEAAEGEAVS